MPCENMPRITQLTHIFTVKLRHRLHFAQAHPLQQRLQQLALQHLAFLTVLRRSACAAAFLTGVDTQTSFGVCALLRATACGVGIVKPA